MNALDPHNPALLIAVMVIALLAIAVWVHHQRTQSKRLEDRFGNEYYRMLDQVGDRGKAEAELRAREKRVEKLNISALSPTDASRFTENWKSLQARFVDNPKGVLVEADRLVHELMLKRGYRAPREVHSSFGRGQRNRQARSRGAVAQVEAAGMITGAFSRSR